MLSPESIMLASEMSLFLTAHISLTGHGRCSFSRLVSSPQHFHFGGIVSRENEGKTKWLLETLLEAMYQVLQESLITDGDHAMTPISTTCSEKGKDESLWPFHRMNNQRYPILYLSRESYK